MINLNTAPVFQANCVFPFVHNNFSLFYSWKWEIQKKVTIYLLGFKMF